MKSKVFGVFASVIGISGALMASANAQNQMQAPIVANPTSTIGNFDIQSVGPVLNELGVAWQARQVDDGRTFIDANVGGVVNFRLAPAACRGDAHTDCVGLSMVAIYDGAANPQTVTAFNYRYAFASAGVDPSGTAYLNRYEISDFGMPRGNLATSILVFAQQAQMFGAELSTARNTVAQQGYADDLSASLLNRTAIGMLTGKEAHAGNPLDAHQRGLEDMAALVRDIVSDENAPRNKINNLNRK